MPALGVAWYYPRDSPETLLYTPSQAVSSNVNPRIALLNRRKTKRLT
jgi:hypothetical protein